MAQYALQVQPFTVAGSGSVIGDTVLQIAQMNDINGVPIVMSTYLGTIAYGTIEPGTATQEESISFTGITQNSNGTATLTGVSTVPFVQPYTATPGLAKSHAGGVTFSITNTAAFYSQFANVNDAETITGAWSFSTIPTISGTPSLNAQAATVAYVNSVAVSGAPNASSTVKGIVQEATVAQVNAGTATGSTGAVLFASPADLLSSNYGTLLPNTGQKNALSGDDSSITVGSGNTFVTQTGRQNSVETFAASTGSANAYLATLTPSPVAYVTGLNIQMKASFTNTGASTLTLLGLTAKAITKNGTQALGGGEIQSGSVYELVYDGTGFQLGTVYTNLVATVVTPVTVANTAALTNLVSVSVPANTLGTSGGIRGRLYMTAQNAGNAATLTYAVSYGGTSLASIGIAFTAVNAGTPNGYIDFLILANAATNAQKASMEARFANTSFIIQNGSVPGGSFALDQFGSGTSAVDSTTSQTLLVTAQWSSAISGTTTTMNHAEIDILK